MPQPVRTCVGCRQRADQAELLRIVWQDGPTADPRRRAPGRGAYLHREPDCLALAVRRRALSRALRLPAGTAVDGEALRRAVEPHLVVAGTPTSRYRGPVA